MANKNRILFLLRLLQERSDEEHPLSSTEIKSALREEGCPATAQTIRDDMKTLQESGFEIVSRVRNGVPTAYYYEGRSFEYPELQILVDALSSSQFITKAKSRKMIAKVADLAGPSYRNELQPRILVSDRVKAPNTQLLYIVQKIQESIRADKKITFKYYDYNLKKERVPRHEGEAYIVSPYATIWKNDRYYLVGYSERREKVASFRIDRMDTPKMIQQPRMKEPDDFNLQNYSDKIFKMFDGPEKTVTLRCQKDMVNHIIDYFGQDLPFDHVTEQTFDVTVPVAVSGTFYSNIFQYGGKIQIIAPAEVREEYRKQLLASLHSMV